MAAPSFSGLTHLNSATYAFALAGAGTPYPATTGASISQLINQTGYVELRGAAGVSGGATLSAIDASTLSADLSNAKVFGASLFLQNTNNFATDDAALQVGIIDTSGVYNVWYLGNADFWNFDVSRYFSLPIVLQPGIGVDASNGTIDLANINRIIAATKVVGNSGTGPWPRLSFYTIGSEGIVLEGGEAGDVHSFAKLDDLLAASSVATEIFINCFVENTTPNSNEQTGQFICIAPVTIRANRFESIREYVFCQDGTRSISIDDSFHELIIEPLLATDYILFSSGTYNNGNKSLSIEVSALADASATILFQDYSFVGKGAFTLRSPASISGGFCGKDEFIYDGGTASGHTLAAATDLIVNCSPGQNLSALNLTLSGSSPVLRLNPDSSGASAINLTGLEASGEIDVQNDTANAITITLAAGTDFTVANNTGGAVTVVAPQPSVTFANIPVTDCYLALYNPDTDPDTEVSAIASSSLSSHQLSYSAATTNLRAQVIFPPGTFRRIDLVLPVANQTIDVGGIAELTPERNYNNPGLTP